MPSTASAAAAPRAVELVCVDPARVAEIWPHVAHLIRRAMERGGTGDFGEVARKVMRGDALLWLAWDGARVIAAAVTELTAVGAVKTCTILACGGDGFCRFGHLLARLEDFARAEGCKRMRICGRPGWRRRLAGYRLKKIIIEKELT